MFVVAGATGNTGSATAEALLAAGAPVRIFARDPGKASRWAARGAEVAVGDVTDASALALAFAGAQAAYVLQPPAYTQPPLRSRAGAGRRDSGSGAAGDTRAIGRSLFDRRASAVRNGHRPHQSALRGCAGRSSLSCDASPAGVLLRELEAGRAAGRTGRRPGELSLARRPRQPMVGAADIGRLAAAAMRDASPPRVIGLAGPRADKGRAP